MEIKEIKIVAVGKNKVEDIGSVQDWGRATLIDFTVSSGEWIKLQFDDVIKLGVDKGVWILKNEVLLDISLDDEWDNFWNALRDIEAK